MKTKKINLKCSECGIPIEGRVAYVKTKPYCKDCVYYAHMLLKEEFNKKEKKKKKTKTDNKLEKLKILLK